MKQNKYLRIFSYAQKYKKHSYTSLGLALLLSALAPLKPLLIQKTMHDYIEKADASASDEVKSFLISAVIWITVIQIAIIILESIFKFLFSYISAILGQYIVKDLRLQVFNKIIHFKLNQFDKTPIGVLSTRTINDIESINTIFSDGFIPIFCDLLAIIVVLGSMFYVNVKLSFIALAVFPLLLIATYLFKQSVKKSFEAVRISIAKFNGYVQERLSGMQFVQVNNLQQIQLEKFKEINEQHKIANKNAIFAYSVFFPFVEIISAISIVFLVYSSIHFTIDASLLLFYFLSLNQIFRPLRFIADKFNTVQMGLIAFERVFAVLDNNESIHTEKKIVKNNRTIEGKIEFKGVSFYYKEGQPVLKNINFKINSGEKIALVGNTGSGKSSIVSLINRLYQHQQGQILIDDINVEDYDINNLRQQIGVILQDVFLFSGTIRQNITFNNSNIKDDEIIKATKYLGFHDMIMKLPNQYDFNVMENGSLLSAGQRQLIAFTRTILFNPKILILDEATSSIDKTSELMIDKVMSKVMQNRTCIIIAHRLSTIQKADKIMFIQSGEVKEEGSHEVLLKKKSFYHDLYFANQPLKK